MRNFIISLILCCGVTATAHADVELKDLADNAPDRYIVVPGDTLWDISNRFLKSPWRWPDLWKKNQQIKDPHWIYPGDILVLTRDGQGASLGFYVPNENKTNNASAVAESETLKEPGTTKLEPHLTSNPLDLTPVRVISGKDVEALIAQPAILSEKTLKEAPHIVSTEEHRIALGRGDDAYVKGIDTSNDSGYWKIVRRGDPLRDPDSGKTLGYFVPDLGNAQLSSQDKNVSTVQITQSHQEIGVGDALIAADDHYPDYQPHAPSQPISGRIIYIANDLFETGTGRLVVINKGIQDGVEDGDVLAIYRDLNTNRKHNDRPIKDRNGNQDRGVDSNVKLTPERNGLLMVVRVFHRASYALIMSADQPVQLNDTFSQP